MQRYGRPLWSNMVFINLCGKRRCGIYTFLIVNCMTKCSIPTMLDCILVDAIPCIFGPFHHLKQINTESLLNEEVVCWSNCTQCQITLSCYSFCNIIKSLLHCEEEVFKDASVWHSSLTFRISDALSNKSHFWHNNASCQSSSQNCMRCFKGLVIFNAVLIIIYVEFHLVGTSLGSLQDCNRANLVLITIQLSQQYICMHYSSGISCNVP